MQYAAARVCELCVRDSEPHSAEWFETVLLKALVQEVVRTSCLLCISPGIITGYDSSWSLLAVLMRLLQHPVTPCSICSLVIPGHCDNASKLVLELLPCWGLVLYLTQRQ